LWGKKEKEKMYVKHQQQQQRMIVIMFIFQCIVLLISFVESQMIAASILYGNKECRGIPKLVSYRHINEISSSMECVSTPCQSVGEYGYGPYLQIICINEASNLTPKSHAQQLFQQETSSKIVVWENYLHQDCIELEEVIVTRANGRCEASLDGISYRFQPFESQNRLIAGQYEQQYWCQQENVIFETTVTFNEWGQNGGNKNKCLDGKYKLEIIENRYNR
jgi:hypothetical protein